MQRLDLKNNQLVSLPHSFSNLRSLQYAYINNNLLPTNYSDVLSQLGLNVYFKPETAQDRLIMKQVDPIVIQTQTQLDQLDYGMFMEVESGRLVSPAHAFGLVNYVDESMTAVSLADYLENGVVVQEGVIYAQVMSSGDGLFPINNHALTAERIAIRFEIPLPTEYELSFDLNGGTSTQPDSQFIIEGSLGESIVAPTRAGYTFTGWNTDIDGNEYAWDFMTSTMPNNDIRLYAQWVVNNYEVTFDINGGDSEVPTSQVVAYGDLVQEPGIQPTKTGYRFNGWNTDIGGNGYAWDFMTSTMPNNDVKLYAQWVVNNYEVTFDINGGDSEVPASQSVAYGDLVQEPGIHPTKTGYRFSGWNTNIAGNGYAWNFMTSTMPNNDVRLYAQWVVNNYEVTFDINGGDSVIPESQSVAYGDLIQEPGMQPTKMGYRFNGWNTTVDGSGDIWNFMTSTMPNNDIRLYAQWVVNNYEVTFDINGGDNEVPASQTVAYGDLVQEPGIQPTKMGYKFNGWNIVADGSGDVWNFITSTMPNNDIRLYAQWLVSDYEVTFDINGGDSEIPVSQMVAYGDLVQEPGIQPTKIGYRFNGWNTAVDGSGDIWDFMTSTMPSSDMTLYAKWQKNTEGQIIVPIFTEVTLNGIFDPMAGVIASDQNGEDITASVAVSDSVDVSTAGIYVLIYTLVDDYGNDLTARQIVLVNDGTYVYDNYYVIHAHDFNIGLSISNITSEKMKELAGVGVYDVKKAQWLNNPIIRVDTSEYIEAVGMFEITFSYNPSITVKMKVDDDTSAKNEKKLPSTGDETNLVLALVGGIIVSLSLLVLKKK